MPPTDRTFSFRVPQKVSFDVLRVSNLLAPSLRELRKDARRVRGAWRLVAVETDRRAIRILFHSRRHERFPDTQEPWTKDASGVIRVCRRTHAVDAS